MATHEPTTEEPTTDEQLTLGKLDHGRPTSTEEFANAIYDEPWTYERVDGRLVVMSPEGTGHVSQSEPWRDRLGAYRLAHPNVVQAVVSQAWIHIDEDNTRIADIGVYLGGPREALNIPDQVPDLVFEIVSPGKVSRRRDYVEKRAQYEKLGVREYVIIDRFDKKVTVLTLGEGGYVEQVLTLADAYRTPLLPGFEIQLAEVMAQ
jgi:Uma2 family endonuclease